jgi:penicillin amidase
MFRDLTTTWREDLVKQNMLGGPDSEKARFLFPVNTAMDVRPGSNGWAISGVHTASGKPLLSNDMHLAYSEPGIWYMTHLQAPGLNVSGVALPGTPGVIVGHNQRIAWGITNLQFDVQDLYIEKIDDAGRYQFRGKTEQAIAEREIISVKGQKPVETVSWITRHGPIFVSEGSVRMALRWTVTEPGLVQYPILDIDRAQNWQEFNAALKRFGGPGSNFVYADVDGNIGYHAAGMLPKRHGFAGDVPVDGTSGEFEWDGFIPFDELPTVYNPPSGLIVTANQNPFPANYPYPVSGNFASPYRARQIRALLTKREKWTAADLLAVQKDVYSEFDHFLARQLAGAYAKRGGHTDRLDTAVRMLKEWDGQMDKDLAAPLIVTFAYGHLVTSLVEIAAAGKAAGYDNPLAPSVVQTLLLQRPADWSSDFDGLLLRALVDGVDECGRQQGHDPTRWRYGSALQVRINHPAVHQVPVIGSWFDIGPVRMSGGRTTVKQTTAGLAPSMRMDADLGNWDASLLNVLTGQSGQILDSHYNDQWHAYYAARSFPMQFERVQAKSTLRFVPQ